MTIPLVVIIGVLIGVVIRMWMIENYQVRYFEITQKQHDDLLGRVRVLEHGGEHG